MNNAHAQEPPSDLELEWSVHLAARSRGQAVVAAGICTLALVLSLALTGSMGFMLLVALSLFGSLADYFLPVRYRLSARGAEARHLWPFASISWGKVRRRTMSKDGIKLSPLRHRSRLEPYRGVLLRFGDRDPSEILDAVRRLQDAYGSSEVSPERRP